MALLPPGTIKHSEGCILYFYCLLNLANFQSGVKVEKVLWLYVMSAHIKVS